MSCYFPRPAFEYVELRTGEVFNKIWRPHVPSSSFPHFFKMIRQFKVPCQQCIGCRDGYSSYWARRCEHESMYHKESSFITLTVADRFMEKIFPGRSLRYDPFQQFMKNFRKKVGNGIKFFMCGEYGEQLSRPHYHSIIFGWMAPASDRFLHKATSVGNLYVSRLLSQVWPYGFSTVSPFSTACASYVAGYITKKINGKLKPKWYGSLSQEFSECSKGVGEKYYHDFKRDLYDGRDGEVLRGGITVPAGRYYDNMLHRHDPKNFERIKFNRTLPNPIRDFMSSPSQLVKRHVVHRARRRAGRNNFGGV